MMASRGYSMSPRQRTTDQKRLPVKSRAKTPPTFRLMPRDIRILRTVLEYRFLYIEQIARALGESTRGVELRLKLLYHNGYVDRIKLPVDRSNKMIYSLREKGAKLLAEAEGIGRDEIAWTRFHNQVTPTHISHLLTINDALISYE